MLVEDVFSIAGRGTVVTGTVTSGTIRTGDRVVVQGASGEIQTTVAGIEVFRRTLDEVSRGQDCGLLLVGVSSSKIQRNAIISGIR